MGKVISSTNQDLSCKIAVPLSLIWSGKIASKLAIGTRYLEDFCSSWDISDCLHNVWISIKTWIHFSVLYGTKIFTYLCVIWRHYFTIRTTKIFFDTKHMWFSKKTLPKSTSLIGSFTCPGSGTPTYRTLFVHKLWMSLVHETNGCNFYMVSVQLDQCFKLKFSHASSHPEMFRKFPSIYNVIIPTCPGSNLTVQFLVTRGNWLTISFKHCLTS